MEPGHPQRQSSGKHIGIGVLSYVVLNGVVLTILCSIDWGAIRDVYRHTPEFWDMINANRIVCQFMIVQPIGLILLSLIIMALRKVQWSTAFAIIVVLIIVEFVNIWFCVNDALLLNAG